MIVYLGPQHPSSHRSPLLVVCISSSTRSTLGHSNHACDTPPLMLQTLPITPASDKIEGFSSEVMVRSNAAGFPRDQLGTRTSTGLVLRFSCPKPLPTSTWADTLARLQHSTNTSRSLLCRETTSPPCLQVMAWWPKGSKARLGQKVQLRP